MRVKATNGHQRALTQFFNSMMTPNTSAIKASYNKATGWMRLNFPDKPSVDILQAMKLRGFRYKPMSKVWTAKWTTERESYAKTLAGMIETVNIMPNWMKKAEYAKTMSAKHQAESTQRYEQFRKELQTIPMGQPILVGHHSEKAHRAHLKRLDRQMQKSIEERNVAQAYGERAQRYQFKAKGESAGLIYRRIRKLEADERKFLKELELIELGKKHPKLMEKMYIHPENEEHWRKWLAHTQERLGIERASYKATGGIATESLQLKAGDMVRTNYGTARVIKVNPKTVTVRRVGSTWNLKIDKSTIRGKAE